MAHDHLRNALPSECVVQTQSISAREGTEVEPKRAQFTLKKFSSWQDLDFGPDVFLSNRHQWQGVARRPAAPRAPTGRQGECPRPSQRQEGQGEG